MALSITTGNGNPEAQAKTQSPQTSAGSGSPAAAPTSSVQPGTATNLLTSQQGISLTNTQLSVVNLSTAPQTITGQQQSAASVKKTHHPSVILIGIVVILVILAMIFSWFAAGSEKNTTV